MAKGPVIADSVRRLIIEIYLRDPSLRAKELRKEVNRVLRGQNPRINREWPGLSAVQKIISDVRKKERELQPDPRDKPWSITSLAQYPIPPEILPVVLEAWIMELLKEDPLTIREVLWIARLFYVFQKRWGKHEFLLHPLDAKQIKEDETGGEPISLDLLISFAKAYALHEVILQLTGGYPNKPEDMWGLWIRDSHLSYALMPESELGNIAAKIIKNEVRNRDQYLSVELIDEAVKRIYGGARYERAHSQKRKE